MSSIFRRSFRFIPILDNIVKDETDKHKIEKFTYCHNFLSFQQMYNKY